MVEKVSFLYSNGDLMMVLNGSSITIAEDHKRFKEVVEGLRTGATEDEIVAMLAPEEEQVVEQEHDHVVTKRIREQQALGLPTKNLENFQKNMKLNPSFTSQQEAYDFLANKGLPISEDGYIIAYKAVDSEYMDKYTRRVSNVVGSVVEMERGRVDDNRSHECSHGYHVGALDYVYKYGNSNDRIVMVKIHPRDVVSVPKDYSHQKMRVCRYEVIGNYEGELKSPLATAEGVEVRPDGDLDTNNGDWDWLGEGHPSEICYSDPPNGCCSDEYDDDFGDYDDDDDTDMEDPTAYESVDEAFPNATEESKLAFAKSLDEYSPSGYVDLSRQHEYLTPRPPTSKNAGKLYHNKRDDNGRFTG